VQADFSYRERALAVGDAHQFLLEEAQVIQDRERALDAQRMERERSEALGLIAHELRQPLTAAIGNLDLAELSLSAGHVERLSPLLGSTRRALDRLSRLSADLVEASRGESPEIVFTDLNLAEVIAQACSWAQPTAETKGIKLRWSVASDMRTPGNADALLSVFGNLLSNAVRYTPSGGRISVQCEADDEWTRVEVEDTGIGMAPEEVERIFDKFYRSPEARATEARGLGLGLSLVQQLVEAHDGRVEVESKPGAGSTFRVLLPRGARPGSEDAKGSVA
jgi:signal transduction histidine kinase